MEAEGGVEALVLAAGAGSRFGGGKLTALWRGRPLVAWAVETAFAAPAAGVTVVTGAEGARVAEAARAADPRVRIIACARWAEGLAASLKAGIASLPKDCEGALVLLGDMPRVPRAVLAPLTEAVRAGAPAAAPVWRGRRGHPAAIGRAMFPELLRLQGDAGAGRLLDALGERLVQIAAPDDGVLFDVDRREDLQGR